MITNSPVGVPGTERSDAVVKARNARRNYGREQKRSATERQLIGCAGRGATFSPAGSSRRLFPAPGFYGGQECLATLLHARRDRSPLHDPPLHAYQVPFEFDQHAVLQLASHP